MVQSGRAGDQYPSVLPSICLQATQQRSLTFCDPDVELLSEARLKELLIFREPISACLLGGPGQSPLGHRSGAQLAGSWVSQGGVLLPVGPFCPTPAPSLLRALL